MLHLSKHIICTNNRREKEFRSDGCVITCEITKIAIFPILEALEKLTGVEENFDTRSGAGILISSLNTFPFFCYLGLWGKILPEVDDVQKYLQTKGLGLDQSVFKIHSLRQFLDDGRDRLFEESIIYAIARCEEMDITITRRVRKRKRLDGVAIMMKILLSKKSYDESCFKWWTN